MQYQMKFRATFVDHRSVTLDAVKVDKDGADWSQVAGFGQAVIGISDPATLGAFEIGREYILTVDDGEPVDADAAPTTKPAPAKRRAAAKPKPKPTE